MTLPPIGRIRSEVWALAWPVILSFGLDSILGLASMLMVGRLGAEAVGAVGLATQILGAVRAGIAAVGTGTVAKATDTVNVQYVGANYTNGKDFDSSWSRGQPTTFPLNGVVPGFAQGIVGMKVGGRREIVIPPALGYGATGQAGVISPDETLVFVVDLISIQ